MGEAGIELLIGSKGNSLDNVPSEIIRGLYNAELIQIRTLWKTRETVELASLESVSWFYHY